MSCRNQAYIGRKLTAEHAGKISAALKGKMPKNIFKPGAEHPFWNPDRTDRRDRSLKEYQEWRYAVIKRDKFTCQLCGAKRSSGRAFHVDHIKSWAEYPELRLEVSNGRVLCEDCHRKTESWGKTTRIATPVIA
jgi:hypothetical protein